MELLDLARRFVDAQFPLATVVIVAGSAARGTRTATSDIDLLLIGPDEMFTEGTDSLAASFAFDGEVFEVFAYTEDGFNRWAARGVEQQRPVIVEMLVEGSALRSGPELDGLLARWKPVFARGPVSDPHELAMRRYVITDLLDDLTDSTDRLEQHVIMASLFEQLGGLLLVSNHRWIGAGKYLPRRLRAWDPERTDQLAAPFLAGDVAGALAIAQRELDAAGGRVQAGFTR